MRNLQKIYEECVQECKNARIPIRDDKVVDIDFDEDKVDGACGICILHRNTNTMSIYISTVFSSDDCPVEELKGVIIHELIHTCSKCWHHKKTWMKYAKMMNEKYGYELTTAKDYDAVFHKEKPILHRYVCENCGSFLNLRSSGKRESGEDICYICPFCNSDYKKIN